MCRLDGAVPGFGFSTIAVISKAWPIVLADADDAVPVRLVARHLLDGDDVAAVLLVGLDHLREAGLAPCMQHVGQEQRERLVADDVARAPDRVAEAERRLLAGEAGRAGLGQVAAQLLELLLLAALASVASSSYGMSKWSSMTALLRPVTKMKCSMPASRASSTTYWMHRPVDDRQHLLRHRLGGGKESRAEAGDGKHGLADAFRDSTNLLTQSVGNAIRSGGHC